MNKPFSLWYIPEPDAYEACSLQINKLAARFRMVSFAPHVTGFSGLFEDTDTAARALDAALEDVSPFTLEVCGLDESDVFFRTFYYRLTTAPEPERVAERLAQAHSRLEGYRLEPHLSLLYKNMEALQRQALVRQEQCSLKHIRFTEAWLVHPLDPESGWRNMANLDVFYKRNL